MRAQLATHQRKSRTLREHQILQYDSIWDCFSVSTLHAQLPFRETESGDGWMCDCDGDLCPASNDEEKRLPETRLGVCFSWTYGTLRNLSHLPSQSPRHFFRFDWAPTPQLGQRVIHAFVHTRELDKYHGYLPATPYPIQRLDSESPSGSLDKYCNVLDWTGLDWTVSGRSHREVSPCTLLGDDGDSKKASAADDGGAHSRMPSTRYAMHASGNAESALRNVDG